MGGGQSVHRKVQTEGEARRNHSCGLRKAGRMLPYACFHPHFAMFLARLLPPACTTPVLFFSASSTVNPLHAWKRGLHPEHSRLPTEWTGSSHEESFLGLRAAGMLLVEHASPGVAVQIPQGGW